MFYLYQRESRVYKVLLYILPVISLSLLAAVYFQMVQANPEIMPLPSEIWNRFVKLLTVPVKGVNIIGHIGTSLLRVLIGAMCAWVIGIAFGILIGWNETCDALFGSVFHLLRPIPPIAWIPLIIMMFGIGEFPKILLVFIGCFFPMVLNTYGGVKLVDFELINVGRIFGANQREILWNIVIPTALPSIFTGIRSSIDNGWKIILAAEMMGATKGIGSLVSRGWNELDMAMVLVCIILIALTGAALSFLLIRAERMLTPWER